MLGTYRKCKKSDQRWVDFCFFFYFYVLSIKCTLNFNLDFEIFLYFSSLYDFTLFIISILNIHRGTVSKPLEFIATLIKSTVASLQVHSFIRHAKWQALC